MTPQKVCLIQQKIFSNPQGFHLSFLSPTIAILLVNHSIDMIIPWSRRIIRVVVWGFRSKGEMGHTDKTKLLLFFGVFPQLEKTGATFGIRVLVLPFCQCIDMLVH